MWNWRIREMQSKILQTNEHFHWRNILTLNIWFDHQSMTVSEKEEFSKLKNHCRCAQTKTYCKVEIYIIAKYGVKSLQ